MVNAFKMCMIRCLCSIQTCAIPGIPVFIQSWQLGMSNIHRSPSLSPASQVSSKPLVNKGLFLSYLIAFHSLLTIQCSRSANAIKLWEFPFVTAYLCSLLWCAYVTPCCDMHAICPTYVSIHSLTKHTFIFMIASYILYLSLAGPARMDRPAHSSHGHGW